MTTFQAALDRYVRKYCSYSVEGATDVKDFTVKHEEGWFNSDSGTSWPASTTITFTAKFPTSKGDKLRSRKVEVLAMHDDPVEFMQALFEED